MKLGEGLWIRLATRSWWGTVAAMSEYVIGRADAIANGTSESAVKALVRLGLWIPLQRGQYAAAEVVEQADVKQAYLLRVAAIVPRLAADAAVSHEAAALLRGWPLLGKPPTLPLFTRPKEPGRTPDRTPQAKTYVAGLPAHHLAEVCGLRVTSEGRTVVDLARRRSFMAGVVTADAALHLGLAREELEQVRRDCSGWPYVRKADAVLDFADGAAESPLESITRVFFRQRSLPKPRLQVEIGGAAFVGRVDLYLEDYAVVVECDGAVKYDSRETLLAEKAREDALRDLGLEVVRVTWADITRRPAQTERRIRAAMARAARRP